MKTQTVRLRRTPGNLATGVVVGFPLQGQDQSRGAKPTSAPGAGAKPHGRRPPQLSHGEGGAARPARGPKPAVRIGPPKGDGPAGRPPRRRRKTGGGSERSDAGLGRMLGS
jgi:hypothetical protein